MRAFAQHLAERTAAAFAGEQPQHVAHDVLEVHALRELRLDMGAQAAQQLGARLQRPAPPGHVQSVQQVGVVVGGTAEHRAVGVRQVPDGLRLGGDAAVDDDLEVGPFALEAIRPVVAQRRDLAVLLRAQALEPGVARMHHERPASRRRDRVDEVAEPAVVVVVVDAQAALHRYRHIASCPGARLDHGGDRIGDQRGLAHQAGAEAPGLHPVRRAAAVKVDLVEAMRRADRCRLRQQGGIAATELQRHRVLDGIQRQQALAVAVDHGVGMDHLRVEPRMRRQQPVEHPAMGVGPVHHRRHRQPDRVGRHRH